MIKVIKSNSFYPPCDGFPELCEEWLTAHWNGGLYIPKNFTELSLQEKLQVIEKAQEKGEEWQRCASLIVELYDEQIIALEWVSGSKSGALLMDNRGMTPWIVMVDAGTHAAAAFKQLAQRAQSLGFTYSIVTLTTFTEGCGYVYADAGELLSVFRYGGRAAPVPLLTASNNPC